MKGQQTGNYIGNKSKRKESSKVGHPEMGDPGADHRGT